MADAQVLFVRFMAATAAILTLASTAHALEIRFSDDVTASSMAVLVNKVALSSRAGERNITVRLDSGGGDLGAALNAAIQLKQYNINTVVSNDCSSACTVLFAAGRSRMASSQATFMFHAVQVARRSSKIFQRGVSKNVRADYTEKYVGLWLAAVRSASPRLASLLEQRHILINGERTFSGRELRSYGYVND